MYTKHRALHRHPCLLSVCSDDAMHGRYASVYLKGYRKVHVNFHKRLHNSRESVDLFVYKISSISPMPHRSKQRQKAWDDGLASSVNVFYFELAHPSDRHSDICPFQDRKTKQQEKSLLICVILLRSN